MTPQRPKYDFKNPLFQKMRPYIRFAKEHISLVELQQKSSVIQCVPIETMGPLKIPTKYHIH